MTLFIVPVLDLISSPVSHVNNLWLTEKQDTELRFKLATYPRPGDGVHDRTVYTIGESLIPTIVEMVTTLPPGEEMGLASRVERIHKGTRSNVHIPMIDFDAKCTLHHAAWACELLEKEFGMKLVLYSSGHSYHAYGDRLLSEGDWLQWNAKLLLVDPAQSILLAPDHRWVGFSLMLGENFLRLSHNTTLSSPITKVARPETAIWSDVQIATSYSRPAETALLEVQEQKFQRYEGQGPVRPMSSFCY